MAKMEWVRWYIGTHADPKFRAVALEAGVHVTAAVAVWAAILEHARKSSEAGVLTDWNSRVVGAALDLTGDQVDAILDAMQGLTLDGNRLPAFGRRNFDSDSSTERVRRHRERARNADETLHGAPETAPEAEADVQNTEAETDGEETPSVPEGSQQQKQCATAAAAAVEKFCERLNCNWTVGPIEPWLQELLQAEPRLDQVNLVLEIGKAADWYREHRRKLKDPAGALGKWLEQAVRHLTKNGHAGGQPPPSISKAQLRKIIEFNRDHPKQAINLRLAAERQIEQEGMRRNDEEWEAAVTERTRNLVLQELERPAAAAVS